MTPPEERITPERGLAYEQLGRDVRVLRKRVLPDLEGSDEGWALDRLLAAYEQEKARADEAEKSRDDLQDQLVRLLRLLGPTTIPALRTRAIVAEARERKYREALERLHTEAVLMWGETSDYRRDDQMAEALDQAHAALTSTPDPENRCATCGSDDPEEFRPWPKQFLNCSCPDNFHTEDEQFRIAYGEHTGDACTCPDAVSHGARWTNCDCKETP